MTDAQPIAPLQDTPITGPLSEEPALGARRLMCLDAFRGLTILGMLLVNNIALDTATPAQLMHAPWNRGLTFADMVFPWFLLAVGVAIPYSAASRRRHHVAQWRYDLKVLGRTVSLVLLGCLVDSSIVRAPYFDLGVLQLIGLAYLLGALLYELHVQRRLLIAGSLLVGYWALLRFLPIPGVGAGVLTPRTNIISHLNSVYLRPYHLEGLLSAVPTAALVMIGTAVGDLLRQTQFSPAGKAARLLLMGLALTVVGWVWSLELPFSKPLWSPSYVLFAGGLGALLLVFLYLVVDATGWRAWSLPLVIPGMNAIFLYVVPILVKIYILQVWTWKLADGSHLVLGTALMHFWFTAAGRVGGGWGYTISYLLFWWLLAAWLYRKKVFLRV